MSGHYYHVFSVDSKEFLPTETDLFWVTLNRFLPTEKALSFPIIALVGRISYVCVSGGKKC